jgi:hypothetical protein
VLFNSNSKKKCHSAEGGCETKTYHLDEGKTGIRSTLKGKLRNME